MTDRSDPTSLFYEQNAEQLSEQYRSVEFDQVHQGWRSALSAALGKDNCRILDVGAGCGRDARNLALMGAEVVAAEPCKALADLGRSFTKGLAVKWIDDALPALNKVSAQEQCFDLILLSAVWMHLAPSERPRALRKLSNLLKPGGSIVVTLRHGQSPDQRQMHPVSLDELKKLGRGLGLSLVSSTSSDADKLGRNEVHWQTAVLQLPDEGTGAFPLLRHIAINDNKSSSYKLALLRVLLRIADGHPGAAVRDGSDTIKLPMGLVALYWCRQFKQAIDHYQVRQNANPNAGLGFIKPNGWQMLTNRSADDYAIGNGFIGEDARALYRTLSHSAQTIRDMPCRYITLPNEANRQVFEVESRSVRASDTLFLDFDSLSRWGDFILPESVWLALSRYACWIEPVLINEWISVVQGYKGNEHLSSQQLHQSLVWAEPNRQTAFVRERVKTLLDQGEQVNCIWKHRKLPTSYDIDHCFPFARWPNNDLWNLCPSGDSINRQKGDKLPSVARLAESKDWIQGWWQQAWLNDPDSDAIQRRFFAEANLALPGLNRDNQSVSDVFEAMQLQRTRLREMQQLLEW
ncbi:class I SAM-dependent methyltransferase [Ferrimonas marina]|uniref:HNH endonuclease n=1 Tax=Ferrimonas marina TaxID=299255 RepID=A0A1M5X8J4_9GAMM|nr:class I SAM-dependent methyltransferase [Ferrimonas marina]SHH95824.1 HNH endonuclease [Ferrimonas marina]